MFPRYRPRRQASHARAHADAYLVARAGEFIVSVIRVFTSELELRQKKRSAAIRDSQGKTLSSFRTELDEMLCPQTP